MRLLPSRVALAITIAGCSAVLGCTSCGLDAGSGEDEVSSLVDGPGYEYELSSVGTGERFELLMPIPVGRSVIVTVGLASGGEIIEVDLVAEVRAADAEGVGQEIDLRVVEVRSDDPQTVDGLEEILDSSSVLRRDERLAVIEQVLDIPEGLGFRADAVARQVLRAPFSLAGPLAPVPVGTDARWIVRTTDGEVVVDEREVTVVEIGDDGYVLGFVIPDGEVEIHGRFGTLLPDLQVITLADAEVTVSALRS